MATTESSSRVTSSSPPSFHHHHHHHHHHQHLLLCPRHYHLYHHHCLHHHHGNSCNFHCPVHPASLIPLPPPPLPNAPMRDDAEAAPSVALPAEFNPLEADSSRQMLAQLDYEPQEEVFDDDEEPVFVLTDEWREFFARSEAKRKLAKREAKKKAKE